MSRLLYIDACGGLAGDMLCGGLLDLGWPLKEVHDLVAALGLTGVSLRDEKVVRQGLAARRLVVEQPEPQPHRHLPEIEQMLGRLAEPVAREAWRVFERLASAEASVHGIAPQEVHFHEVGAVDALVEISAFCAGLQWLKASMVICSPLPLARGFTRAAHGRLPLPAPAVLALLSGAPSVPWPAAEETVTPTGAALVATLSHQFGEWPAMLIEKVGLGGGGRESQAGPNVVRLVLGSRQDELLADRVVELVCHLDDQSPEDLPMIMERLMASGALDAAAGPLYMKKGRPGLALTVLASPADAQRLAAEVLAQTTTLGVRMRGVERRLLAREVISIKSPWGPVRVKLARLGEMVRLHPEADDVARICRETGLPPTEVRRRLKEIASQSKA